jgi:hypothetical protein
MIALRLIRFIEAHSEEIARQLTKKIQSSPRSSQMKKVSEPELVGGLQELLQHLSEWLLTKTESDVEVRYREIAARRARQAVPLSDFCWSLVMTKECLWEYLQKQGFLPSPIELYGEMELLSLLNQFFDRALCYTAEGYEQARLALDAKQRQKKYPEFNPAAFVP